MWTSTAVALVAGLQDAFADATAEGLWLQVSALLLELGVLSGARRLLVLGDGAAWIRTWFEGLGMSPKAMIVCRWHLRKCCYEQMSSPGGPKDRRRAFEKELLGRLWEGEVDAAIELLKGVMEWVRDRKAVEELFCNWRSGGRTSPTPSNDSGRGYGSRARGWRSSTTGRSRGAASTRG